MYPIKALARMVPGRTHDVWMQVHDDARHLRQHLAQTLCADAARGSVVSEYYRRWHADLIQSQLSMPVFVPPYFLRF